MGILEFLILLTGSVQDAKAGFSRQGEGFDLEIMVEKSLIWVWGSRDLPRINITDIIRMVNTRFNGVRRVAPVNTPAEESAS
uniref:Uncharacterized protein n=1 Tax=Solanum tuberosum TaxID=4113 RepID=M1DN54_SOLTU